MQIVALGSLGVAAAEKCARRPGVVSKAVVLAVRAVVRHVTQYRDVFLVRFERRECGRKREFLAGAGRHPGMRAHAVRNVERGESGHGLARGGEGRSHSVE